MFAEHKRNETVLLRGRGELLPAIAAESRGPGDDTSKEDDKVGSGGDPTGSKEGDGSGDNEGESNEGCCEESSSGDERNDTSGNCLVSDTTDGIQTEPHRTKYTQDKISQ